jgi:hypothetical protein
VKELGALLQQPAEDGLADALKQVAEALKALSDQMVALPAAIADEIERRGRAG